MSTGIVINRHAQRAIVASTKFYELVFFEERDGNVVESEATNRIVADDGLDGVVILTVPEATTTRMAADIADRAQKALGRKVLVLSSNVKYASARELTKDEAADAVKQMADTLRQGAG